MKTIQEILDEVENEYGLGGLSSGLYADYATDVAKRYSEQFIDSAADQAKVKFNSPMAIISAKEFKINSGTYSVSKQSILNLKDQLK